MGTVATCLTIVDMYIHACACVCACALYTSQWAATYLWGWKCTCVCIDACIAIKGPFTHIFGTATCTFLLFHVMTWDMELSKKGAWDMCGYFLWVSTSLTSEFDLMQFNWNLIPTRTINTSLNFFLIDQTLVCVTWEAVDGGSWCRMSNLRNQRDLRPFRDCSEWAK